MSPLAAHHLFPPAIEGHITCLACGRTYTAETGWRAEVEPCLDGQPTGISEELAKLRWREAYERSIRGDP
jgi:hypothetical protein